MLAHGGQYGESTGEILWNDAGFAWAEFGGLPCTIGNANTPFDDAEKFVLARGKSDVPGTWFAGPDTGSQSMLGGEEVFEGGA